MFGTTKDRIVSPSTKRLLVRAFFVFSIVLSLCGKWNCLAAQGVDHFVGHYWIGREEGLPDSNPLRLFQDSQGYMWIWSGTGVYRYNGRSFQPFLQEKNFYPRAGSHLHFLGCRDGLVWLVHSRIERRPGALAWHDVDITLFDPASKRTYTFGEYFGNCLPFGAEEVRGIARGRGGVLWFGLESGRAYSYRGGRLFLQELDNGGALPLSFVLPASDTSFWALGEGVLMEVDKCGALLEEEPFLMKPAPDSPMMPVGKGVLLSFDTGGKDEKTYLFKKKGRPFSRFIDGYQEITDKISKIDFGRREQLWEFGKDSIRIMERGGGEAVAFSKSRLLPGEKPNIANAMIDRQGRAWVCSEGKVLVIWVHPQLFFSLSENIDNTRGIIELPDGSLCVNSYSGQRIITEGRAIAAPIRHPSMKAGLGLELTPDGSIWSGVHGPGVLRMEWPGQGWRVFPLEDSVYRITTESRVLHYDDENGRLWLGAATGLAYYDERTGGFRFWYHPLLDNVEINWFHENEEGLWMATGEGLRLLDGSREKVSAFTRFPFLNFTFLHEDQQGDFWLATKGGGMIYWDRENDEARQYTVKQGLSDNIVHAIYEDTLGALWLPTNKGLCRFDKKSGSTRVFLKEDGIAGNEFNAFSHYRAKDGTLYFGGMQGLTWFHPEGFRRLPTREGPLVMESCWYVMPDGSTQSDSTVWPAGQAVRLPASHEKAGFSFAWLDMWEPGGADYYYRLDGEGAAWKKMSQDSLEFYHLSPGKHILRVKAQSPKGAAAPWELKIPIEVMKPFYLKAWFLALMVLLLFFLVRWAVYLRTLHLEREKKRLEREVARRTIELEKERLHIEQQNKKLDALNRMKDKLFAMIGHELRGPVGHFQHIGKNIAYLMRKGEYERAVRIGEQLEKTSVMANVMLDNLLRWGRAQTREIPCRQEKVELASLVHDMLDAFAPLAEGKKITLRYEGPDEGGLFLFVDASALQLILRNLISNAIKFTPRGGEVVARCYSDGRRAKILVEDNGVGIPPERMQRLFELQESTAGTEGENGSGLGLHLCNELARANRGEVEVSSRPGRGTTFTVYLPLAMLPEGHSASSRKRPLGADFVQKQE